MSYNINYNDERFTQVEADKKQAVNEVNKTYDKMINDSDSYYKDQIEAVKNYGDKQTQFQQEQTDFTVEKIEQQKEQAHKDYLKEQSGAYTDWQKESNKYGVKAEQQAASGLEQSGYSESSKVSMYNTYQNRVAASREAYNKAVLNYENSMKEARLQNNSLLAEIAYNTLKTSLELSLQGFQYKNELVLQKVQDKREVDNTYYSRFQDVVSQINQEKSLAEQIRQYNESLTEEKRQYDLSFAEQKKQYKNDYNLKVKELKESIRQFDIEIKRLKAQDKKDNAYKIKQLELQKNQLEEEKRQYDLSLAEDKRQFNAKNGISVSKGNSGSSGSTGSKSISAASIKKKQLTKANENENLSSNEELSIDFDSIKALGTPYSAAGLNNAIKSGEIVEYIEDGKLKYRKATAEEKIKNTVNNKANKKTASSKASSSNKNQKSKGSIALNNALTTDWIKTYTSKKK